MRDLKEAAAYESYALPKTYSKVSYCVSCAVHRRVVRGRSAEGRRVRAAPVRRFRKVMKKKEEGGNKA